ncbi:hypothetical protein QFZ79_004072 [Arthrobacter sp. V4I6]|uniref:DUF6766 family protein n=1 Tax=unclassified Arthrobacter TaxID=235627 RepID=UPI00277DA533|nr:MULTISPECIES: DUF6766 family protein [unclassified Arthrobacter]MDQ0821697.1 hypothetical protein [Arthrobacter sp. V1I7]MDQ0855961.1 hypothetical protein [Arthrobacter sp. V4I6]
MKKAVRNNGLSLFFGVIFLLALLGQGLTGHALFNQEQVSAGLDEITAAQYLTSSSFAVDVSENWQSEYLQFLLYVFATIWLVQKGSPESKEVDQGGLESDEKQLVGEHSNPKSPAWAKASGWRRTVYSNSLGLTMGLIFILSWLVQSIAGNSAYNEEQLRSFQQPVGWTEYLVSPEFWNRTLQNWQSEFLAVGSMVVLSIYLRQRGSPESKPVGSAHDDTGMTG